MLGRIPQNLLEEQLSRIMQWHGNNSSLVSPDQFLFQILLFKTVYFAKYNMDSFKLLLKPN